MAESLFAAPSFRGRGRRLTLEVRTVPVLLLRPRDILSRSNPQMYIDFKSVKQTVEFYLYDQG